MYEAEANKIQGAMMNLESQVSDERRHGFVPDDRRAAYGERYIRGVSPTRT
jgi:hypothetical protein